MRIRFLESIASVEGWSYGAQQEADFPDDRARAFICGRLAESLDPDETARIRKEFDAALAKERQVPIETANDTQPLETATSERSEPVSEPQSEAESRPEGTAIE